MRNFQLCPSMQRERGKEEAGQHQGRQCAVGQLIFTEHLLSVKTFIKNWRPFRNVSSSSILAPLFLLVSPNLFSIYRKGCVWILWLHITSVHFSSVTQSCLTLCYPMNCSMPGLLVHHRLPELLKLMPIESMMPSSHLILCLPLLLLPPITPSIRVFSNESALRMRWPKYWRFSFCISPSNENPGLISFI